MAIMKTVKSGELFMGKLTHGSDLLEEITEICRNRNVQLGRIEGFGAVQRARLGFYDQQSREYRFFVLEKPLEITKLVGNVSLKDNHPFVHAHVTLADERGNAFGGHLAGGTVVFACEFILQAFEGAVFKRGFDEATGLPLWIMSE